MGNRRGIAQSIIPATAFCACLILAAMLLAGCLVPVPIPVPVQVPFSTITPEPTVMMASLPAVTITTPVPETTEPEPTTIPTTETPVPLPTLPAAFAHPLAKGSSFFFTDNVDFHKLSVSISGTQMRTGFYYSPGTSTRPTAHLEAPVGYKYLMVGVDFYMTGINKEGKSSIFMTPIPVSFQLVHDGVFYGTLNASDIPGMEDYYIRDIGSMYRAQFINKDDDGSGILIYEVPQEVDTSDAYIAFCPVNLESWSWSGYFRSPDDWDCDNDEVVWALK